MANDDMSYWAHTRHSSNLTHWLYDENSRFNSRRLHQSKVYHRPLETVGAHALRGFQRLSSKPQPCLQQSRKASRVSLSRHNRHRLGTKRPRTLTPWTCNSNDQSYWYKWVQPFPKGPLSSIWAHLPHTRQWAPKNLSSRRLCQSQPEFAKKKASICGKYTSDLAKAEAHRACRQLVAPFNLILPAPFKIGVIKLCLERYQDYRWWRKQLHRLQNRRIDEVARNMRTVQHNANTSGWAIQTRRSQKPRKDAYLFATSIVNNEGQSFTLKEIADRSVSNPYIPRNPIPSGPQILIPVTPP